jgi:hypothetical protein
MFLFDALKPHAQQALAHYITIASLFIIADSACFTFCQRKMQKFAPYNPNLSMDIISALSAIIQSAAGKPARILCNLSITQPSRGRKRAC